MLDYAMNAARPYVNTAVNSTAGFADQLGTAIAEGFVQGVRAGVTGMVAMGMTASTFYVFNSMFGSGPSAPAEHPAVAAARAAQNAAQQAMDRATRAEANAATAYQEMQRAKDALATAQTEAAHAAARASEAAQRSIESSGNGSYPPQAA